MPSTTSGRSLSPADRRLRRKVGARAAALGLAVLALVVGVGCDQGPTHPDESVIVTGVLAAGQVDDYPLPLTFEGLVRFTIEELRLRQDGEVIEDPAFTVSIGFGLGRPTETEGCQGSSRLALVEGQSRSYRLLAEEYCIALFDPGTLTEGLTISYAVQAETTD
jgi:hypothetical protein